MKSQSKALIRAEIMALAWPAIASNVTTPLLGLVDTAVTGHMGAAAYVGAIAVGGSMLSLAYWPLNFLRMGTSGLTSQAYGANLRGADAQPLLVLCRAAVVALAASAILLAVSPWLGRLLLAFMGADQSTTMLAGAYFRLVLVGAPAVLGTYALAGWLLGMQDSRTPMWMALITNVSNILISLMLVYGCGMKIEGVAIGTLSAQWLGLLGGAVIAWKRHGQEYQRLKRLKGRILKSIFEGAELRRFFRVNTDIFLRTVCLASVTLWFTHAGAVNGTDALAANALLMQLFILFSYFMDGFAFAGEAMAGKYFGQRDWTMLRATVRGIFHWGAIVALAFTAIYAGAGKVILQFLTDDAQIVDTAMRYLPWAVAVPFAGVAAFVWDGIFIGITLTGRMLLSMAIATAVFFGLYFIFSPTLANHGLWLAFIAYLLARGLAQTALYKPR